jgi:hypothetical protein
MQVRVDEEKVLMGVIYIYRFIGCQVVSMLSKTQISNELVFDRVPDPGF